MKNALLILTVALTVLVSATAFAGPGDFIGTVVSSNANPAVSIVNPSTGDMIPATSGAYLYNGYIINFNPWTTGYITVQNRRGVQTTITKTNGAFWDAGNGLLLPDKIGTQGCSVRVGALIW